MSTAMLDEIVELVDAADGRTLGLFSSRRAAEAAAEVVRERLPHLTTLAQGDAQLPELAAQFVGDPHTCLFGTLSLWQGLDVPGDTCQLVLIDRIPFPRPDDPLLSARQKAADQAGGNGFMQVAATHAALLLAQGAGPADPHAHRPRRRRRARPAARDGAVRRVPQGQPAADVDDDRPGRRARRAAAGWPHGPEAPRERGPPRTMNRSRRPAGCPGTTSRSTRASSAGSRCRRWRASTLDVRDVGPRSRPGVGRAGWSSAIGTRGRAAVGVEDGRDRAGAAAQLRAGRAAAETPGAARRGRRGRSARCGRRGGRWCG